MRHGLRILPIPVSSPVGPECTVPAQGASQKKRAQFWRKGEGGRSLPPGGAHAGPLIPSRVGTEMKPGPRGLLLASFLGPDSSTAQGVALHPLPPCAWPLRAGLAHRYTCTRRSHGAARTHSGTLLHCSHCPLKSENQGVSKEVRPLPHSHQDGY